MPSLRDAVLKVISMLQIHTVMLLSLILLYYIGNHFYKLAKAHQKNGWVFAILGIVSYYAGTIVGGIIIAVFIEAGTSSSIDDIPDFTIDIISIPFGILSYWFTYRFLKKQWSKPRETDYNPEVLDGNLRQAD